MTDEGQTSDGVSGAGFPDLRTRRRSKARFQLALIDGPNMSNLRTGGRDRRTYGTIESIEVLHAWLKSFAESLGVDLDVVLSNHEGEIIEYVHRSSPGTHAYLINPAGLNCQGEALYEALRESGRPVVELHFANIAAIGYQMTVFTRSVQAMTMGLRHYGYLASIFALVIALDDDTFLGAAAGTVSAGLVQPNS
jgi:3-dehydroquinate dehydratase-2